jgi:hypothetical protein
MVLGFGFRDLAFCLQKECNQRGQAFVIAYLRMNLRGQAFVVAYKGLRGQRVYGVRLLLLPICGVKEEVVVGCFSRTYGVTH